MRATITGTTLPVLQVELSSGETLLAGPDQLSWFEGPIEMTTSAAAGGSSGLWGAVTRAVSGGGLFMTEFKAQGGAAAIAFAARVPGTIHQVEVVSGKPYYLHKHGFVCATHGAELGSAFQQSLGAGAFGGEGFVLQKLSGNCTAWVELGGETLIRELAPGETLYVHPGHVGMFEEGVSFEITTIRGVKNVLFGGDGLFLAKLTGPGKVWLQTLTLSKLAHALAPYLPHESK